MQWCVKRTLLLFASLSRRRMSFVSPCPSCKGGYPQSSGFFGKFCLHKVFIEGIRYVDSKPLHYNKRYTIGEGVALVLMLLKIKPSRVEKFFINMNHVHGRAVEKSVSDLDGLGIVSTTIEKRDHLIEDIGCCDQARQSLDSPPPVLQRSGVILIIGKLERKQIACVNKNRCHFEVR